MECDGQVVRNVVGQLKTVIQDLRPGAGVAQWAVVKRHAAAVLKRVPMRAVCAGEQRALQEPEYWRLGGWLSSLSAGLVSLDVVVASSSKATAGI